MSSDGCADWVRDDVTTPARPAAAPPSVNVAIRTRISGTAASRAASA